MRSFILSIIIKNGKILDGTGNPWFQADLLIEGEKITKIGYLERENADQVIDAKRLIVSPGFIDIHSHADATNFLEPKQESSIRQGITTHVAGNCGYSLAPINPEKLDLLKKYLGAIIPSHDSHKFDWTTFGEYLSKIEEIGIASNMKLLVGHGTIRIAVMGFDDRAPTEKELDLMKEYVIEAMNSGAMGISTGLFYPPGWFAKTEEIIELAKIVARYNGYYYSHLRSYAGELRKSVQEAIEIGEKTGVKVQISHASVFGSPYWGRSKTFLRLIKKARDNGIEVGSDMHAYDSVNTDILMLLPPWSYEGGKKKTLECLKHSETRDLIIHQIKNGPEKKEDWPEWVPFDLLGVENILPLGLKSEKYGPFEGKNLSEIAKLQEADPFETLIDLLIEEELDPEVIITHLRGEEDIINFLRSPIIAFETDSAPRASQGITSKNLTHLRTYGTYPKFLGEFVRERKLLSLEEAIRKSTSLPAQLAGILDRGLIRPNFHADIVIFDPASIIDTATYTNPHQYPIGIKHVLVNGTIVLREGERSEHLPGKILRHGK